MLLLSRSRLRIGGISVMAYDKLKCVSFSDDKNEGSKDGKDTQEAKELKVLKYRKKQETKIKKDTVIKTGALKKKYRDKPDVFLEKDLVWKEPLSQFRVWYDEATRTPGIVEASAMCLATASKDGIPAGRLMLLKSFSIDGFKFFTSYESRHARDLEVNPRASLAFFWEPLDRQVLVYGKVEKTSKDESDKYFASRPRVLQITTWACRQPTILSGREDLIKRVNEVIEQYKGKDIPRPDCWGGYILLPEIVEFWQGQTDRLHDRIIFRHMKPGEEPDGVKLHRGEDEWVYERFSP